MEATYFERSNSTISNLDHWAPLVAGARMISANIRELFSLVDAELRPEQHPGGGSGDAVQGCQEGDYKKPGEIYNN